MRYGKLRSAGTGLPESRTVTATVELGFDGTAVDIVIDPATDEVYVAFDAGNEVVVIGGS